MPTGIARDRRERALHLPFVFPKRDEAHRQNRVQRVLPFDFSGKPHHPQPVDSRAPYHQATEMVGSTTLPAKNGSTLTNNNNNKSK